MSFPLLQFSQFTCWVSLGDAAVPDGQRCVWTSYQFHVFVCERLILFDRVDFEGLDTEEMAYRIWLWVISDPAK